MACFVTPLATAAVTTLIKSKIPAKLRPDWLLLMLWGAVAALIVDHAINGELTLYPPFLTALENNADTAIMLKEIAITGTSMTLAIFIAWGCLLFVSRIRKNQQTSRTKMNAVHN